MYELCMSLTKLSLPYIPKLYELIDIYCKYGYGK